MTSAAFTRLCTKLRLIVVTVLWSLPILEAAPKVAVPSYLPGDDEIAELQSVWNRLQLFPSFNNATNTVDISCYNRVAVQRDHDHDDCHVMFSPTLTHSLRDSLENLLLFAPTCTVPVNSLNGQAMVLPMTNGTQSDENLFAAHYFYATAYNGVSNAIYDRITALCDTSSDRLVFSGWSRGGAMSSVAAAHYYLEGLSSNITLITFGAPRALGKESSDAVHGKFPQYRAVSPDDLWTKLPLISSCLLIHFGENICDHCSTPSGRDGPFQPSVLDAEGRLDWDALASLLPAIPNVAHHAAYPPNLEYGRESVIDSLRRFYKYTHDTISNRTAYDPQCELTGFERIFGEMAFDGFHFLADIIYPPTQEIEQNNDP